MLSSTPKLPALPLGQRWLSVEHGESGAQVYRSSDGQRYAKLAAQPRALEAEWQRTTWAAAQGLAVPHVLDWISNDDGSCLVTSALPGVPASALSAKQLTAAWPSMVQQLRELHAFPVDACPFERGLRSMYTLATEVVARNAVNPDFLAPEDRALNGAQLLARIDNELPQRLAQEANDRVVCHGNACTPNFLIDPDTLRCTGMIDLGRLGTADRYVDLSLLLANAREAWQTPQQAQRAHDALFALLAIPQPDHERLRFYLRLDPLTWG
jgi:streptomycin 3"-kinase